MLYLIAPKILELVSDCLKEEKLFAILKTEIKPVNNYICIWILYMYMDIYIYIFHIDIYLCI